MAIIQSPYVLVNNSEILNFLGRWVSCECPKALLRTFLKSLDRSKAAFFAGKTAGRVDQDIVAFYRSLSPQELTPKAFQIATSLEMPSFAHDETSRFLCRWISYLERHGSSGQAACLFILYLRSINGVSSVKQGLISKLFGLGHASVERSFAALRDAGLIEKTETTRYVKNLHGQFYKFTSIHDTTQPPIIINELEK